MLLKEALEKEPQDALAPVLLSAVMLGTGRSEEGGRSATRCSPRPLRVPSVTLLSSSCERVRASRGADESTPRGRSA